MAKLIIKSEGFRNQIFELKLGVNRLGRSPGNDFQIDHPTISAVHCEIDLQESGLVVRDCNSTNGTYVGERPVSKASLWAGQVLRLGDIELLVESTEVRISIPKFEVPQPAPPVVQKDGSMLCPRHSKPAPVTYQCTNCRQVMCDECVHRIRRRGGKLLKLCPECSHTCEPLIKPPKKKRSLVGFLSKTVKLPFLRVRKED
jgi:pSer/pThr/pTyr-binding forkhead associated (FHA) protein